ncbi:MAG TPA: hypothetical protein VKB78_02935 [Pirellulales bacterium]|nr:hypothetical protein [Pirellulales bacterium]
MDPLYLAIAFVPLALYLIGLAGIHLMPRPIVWTGALDVAALGAGVSGMIVAGPMDLFLPESSPMSGMYLWMLMLTLYVLAITLWNLLSRPRLVIFNITAEQLRPMLSELVKKLDEGANSTGDSFLLPQVGLQFHIERYLPFYNVSLVAIGDRQSFSGWRRLRSELAAALAEVKPASRIPGFAFLVVGLVMLSSAVALAAGMDRTRLRHEFRDLLRIPPGEDSRLG